MESELSCEKIYKLIDLKFSDKFSLYSHLYDSYNKFIEEDIPVFLAKYEHLIHEEYSEKDRKIYKYKFKYTNYSVEMPKNEKEGGMLLPMQARINDLTYSIKIMANVTQYIEIIDLKKNINNKTIIETHNSPNVVIATIPTMVRSKYCNTKSPEYEKRKNEGKKIKLGDKEFLPYECDNDPGGYFIVGGKEKAIISQEKICENKIFVFTSKSNNPKKTKESLDTNDEKIYSCDLFSRSYRINGSVQIMRLKIINNVVVLKVPVFNDINALILLRILGIQSDKEIMDFIVDDINNESSFVIDTLRKLFDNCKDENGKKICSESDAMNYIIRKIKMKDNEKNDNKSSEIEDVTSIEKKKNYITYNLLNNFIPHIEGSYKVKGLYLLLMIKKLIYCMAGKIEPDSRDSYINKRIDLPGDLMFEIFKLNYKKLLNECKSFFQKKIKSRGMEYTEPLDAIVQIKSSIIEHGIRKKLSRGQWPKRDGVAQVLERLTFLQAISFLRRVDSPNNQQKKEVSGRLIGPRMIHTSCVPFLCIIQTPEHDKVGLMKHLSLISTITVVRQGVLYEIIRFIKDDNDFIDIKVITIDEIKSSTKIFVNGIWIGNTFKPIDLKLKLDNIQKISYSKYVSIIFDAEIKEIKIYCDSGRFIRPVLVVKNNSILLNSNHLNSISLNKAHIDKISDWDNFLSIYNDVIEYIDVEKQPFVLIADDMSVIYDMKKKKDEAKLIPTSKSIINRYDKSFFLNYSHCEIHPSVLVGEIVANIPFLNHNQGNRNIFSYAQVKQALSVYNSVYRYRIDTSHILMLPQVPLVSCRASNYVGTNAMPSGVNVVVAIACYTGKNQEDSLIFNKASIERGLFTTYSLKRYDSKLTKNFNSGDMDKFEKPPETSHNKHINYSKLNDKGYAPEETIINNGDAILGLSSQSSGNKIYKGYEYKSAVVDSVYPNLVDNEGYDVRKMRIRCEKEPVVGDKFACYTPDHDILTFNGWKPISNISLNDMIACLDINNDKLYYSKPLEIMKYDYNGDIYVLHSNNISLKVTPNHRMLVADDSLYNIHQAKNIFGLSKKYKKNISHYELPPNKHNLFIYNNNNPSHIKIGNKIFNLSDWLLFFGILLVKGSTTNTSVCFSVHNIKLQKLLLHLCSNMNLQIFNSSEFIFNDFNWFIYDSNLISYFNNTLSSIYNNLPDWTWFLSQKQSKLLLNGLIIGNENFMKNKTHYFDTSSTSLADDLQKLCLHAGYSCDIIQNESINDKKLKLIIFENNYNPIVNINKRDDKYEYYQGPVHCCRVSGDGIIYVRHNKIPSWSGNSSHGQKGTIGAILKIEDMPYTNNGIIPDIILNPNAIPSRKTIGQLLESLIGKLSALNGLTADGTPFRELDMDKIYNELEIKGFNKYGYEYLTNGMTGEVIKNLIFIGPTYYRRLRHLVMDKIHSRARGPITILTRQPLEGRANYGGLKIGEMERDAFIAHGMAKLLKEKFMENSDLYSTYVCDLCGLFAQRLKNNQSTNIPRHNDAYTCISCKNSFKISKIEIPYAFKLLVQELMSINLAPRIFTKK